MSLWLSDEYTIVVYSYCRCWSTSPTKGSGEPSLMTTAAPGQSDSLSHSQWSGHLRCWLEGDSRVTTLQLLLHSLKKCSTSCFSASGWDGDMIYERPSNMRWQPDASHDLSCLWGCQATTWNSSRSICGSKKSGTQGHAKSQLHFTLHFWMKWNNLSAVQLVEFVSEGQASCCFIRPGLFLSQTKLSSQCGSISAEQDSEQLKWHLVSTSPLRLQCSLDSSKVSFSTMGSKL